MNGFGPEIRTGWRIISFQASSDELQALNVRHLLLGFACTWLVGIGRWWEDPRAGLLQHLGVGSVVYVFVLASFLWAIVWLLNPPRLSYLNLLTFISLTSPPAILYALPVRHGLDLDTAQTVRFAMLGVVAAWRVALLAFYLRRGTGLSESKTTLGTVFPLAVIVFTLTVLNLDRVVFNIMGAISPAERSVNDTAYGFMVLITLLCFYAFVPLVIIYISVAIQSTKERLNRAERSPVESALAKL